jgi:hypothetical protein
VGGVNEAPRMVAAYVPDRGQTYYLVDDECDFISDVKEFLGNYIGTQATGNGVPAKTAARAVSMGCPCLCMVER